MLQYFPNYSKWRPSGIICCFFNETEFIASSISNIRQGFSVKYGSKLQTVISSWYECFFLFLACMSRSVSMSFSVTECGKCRDKSPTNLETIKKTLPLGSSILPLTVSGTQWVYGKYFRRLIDYMRCFSHGNVMHLEMKKAKKRRRLSFLTIKNE